MAAGYAGERGRGERKVNACLQTRWPHTACGMHVHSGLIEIA